MPQIIETGLPAPSQPFSWATHANGIMYTTHGPVDADGRIAGADITAQAVLTFDNLAMTIAASGAALEDVVQVLIYMRAAQDMPAIDAVYRKYFSKPYPNRSSVAVQGFVHPEMRIEVIAYVRIPPQPAQA
ncbi:Putative translation initiation inhibitor [Collimonas arenae]|uniref:Putative translation initiation inhibitor n=1 Tax=Collimonas arenae TaxID=279058 RepID=A0A0A1FB33_9BURK|nr:RidA family protein [Collimonas arenae]AIY41958.1 Putative translation initiation inhibitor [Collimonas arenae]